MKNQSLSSARTVMRSAFYCGPEKRKWARGWVERSKELCCWCALFLLAVMSAYAETKYPAKLTFNVTDDTGAPVSAGVVRAFTFARWERGEGFGRDIHDRYEAQIANDGTAVITGNSLRGTFDYVILPMGKYYAGSGETFQFLAVKGGRWEPFDPVITVKVPRIMNPVPLYARRVGESPRQELPNLGPVGFDLVVSDWVTPHGKGKLADLIFTHQANIRAAHVDAPFDSVFTIAFANRGDGIQSRPAKPGKRLLELPRKAPEEGYETALERRIMWAGQGTNMQTGTREDQNYFLRVRTVLDPDGKVISALYGKIYGDIRFFAPPMSNGMVRFTYYLNPTPLDRNLEFDPKRNLFPDTLHGTNVSEP